MIPGCERVQQVFTTFNINEGLQFQNDGVDVLLPVCPAEHTTHLTCYVQRTQEDRERGGRKAGSPHQEDQQSVPWCSASCPDWGLEKPAMQKCQWAQTGREELLSVTEGAAWQDGNTHASIPAVGEGTAHVAP